MTLTLLLLLTACTGAQPPSPEPVAHEEVAPDPVTQRVEASHAALQATPGGQALREALDAHGGLERWLRAGTVQFTFSYLRAGKPEGLKYTRNQVDIQGSRVRQTVLDDSGFTFGFDGSKNWRSPGETSFKSSTEFWALTPYYFVGMPFVLADPGTKHELLEDVVYKGEAAQAVKVTFDPGTGEAPDDYYVLYLDPETHYMLALRYIVTSPVLFKDKKGKSQDKKGKSKEKILHYTAPVEVGGLRFSGRYDGYMFDPETMEEGALASEVDVTDIVVGEPLSDETFSPPVAP